MSKAKASAKTSATVESTTTATPEVTMSAQVETTAVETTEASATRKGVGSGEKQKMIDAIMAKVESGELKFAGEGNRKIAVSPKGSRVILEIIEKDGDKRAKHAGKSVTCSAWVESDRTEGEGESAKVVVDRSMKVNGKSIWLAVDPDYKFPTVNGAFVSSGEKRPRSAGAKKPVVVHSVTDML